MTLDAFRALCRDHGTGRIARAIGRDPSTLRDWLADRATIGRNAADWLDRIESVRVRGERVTVIVRAPAGPEPRYAPTYPTRGATYPRVHARHP